MAHITNGELCEFVDSNYHIGLEEAIAHAFDLTGHDRNARPADGPLRPNERLYFWLLDLWLIRHYKGTAAIHQPYQPHASDVTELIDEIDSLKADLNDPEKFGGCTKCRRQHEDLLAFLIELCDRWMESAPIRAAMALNVGGGD